MSTNTLKQALEIVYGDIKNIIKRVKNLESASIGVLYTETTKSAVAYQDNVSPNACPYALLNKVGGMSYKCYQLFDKDSYNYSNKYYNNIGSLTSATDNSMHDEAINVLPNTQYTFSVNTTQAFLGVAFFNDSTFISKSQATNATSITFTTPSNCNKVYFNTNYNTQTISANYLSTIEPMLNLGSTALPYQPYFEGIRDSAVTSGVLDGKNILNLDNSKWFMSGDNGTRIINSEGSGNSNYTFTLNEDNLNITNYNTSGYTWLSQFINLKPNTTYYAPYNNISYRIIGLNSNVIGTVGTPLKLVNSVSASGTFNSGDYEYYMISFYSMGNGSQYINRGSNDLGFTPYIAPITKTIPSEIQALEGYGWGINDTCYNYIDFINKKFIQKVGTRAYQSGDEEDTSVLTDLTITYYELATPIETDISSLLPADFNSIQIEPNGTITFDNQYQQAIPYEYLFLEKVGANNE